MKHPITSPEDIAALRFDDDGLVPVIAQDDASGAVLMLAWANHDTLRESLQGRMTYWSRSRGRTWRKGEESGNAQDVVGLFADCDRDAVLAIVRQHGPACHEGTATCWSASAGPVTAGALGHVDHVARKRLAVPEGRYTDTLLADPLLAAEKVVEEAAEVAAVLRGEPNDDDLEHEAADLLYHLVVACRAKGVPLARVLDELARRR